MDYFWIDREHIPDGLGFSLFSSTHILELSLAIIFCIFMMYIYSKSDEVKRDRIRKIIVVAMWIDEALKHIELLATGQWAPSYLPLHLCSINIFFCSFQAYSKDKKFWADFLWAICVPTVILTLISPAWIKLPFINFMQFHHFSIHALLLAYPMMLMAGREVDRKLSEVPRILIVLAVLAVMDYGVNLFLSTNFMYLMRTDNNGLLNLLQNIFGSHLTGLLILAPIMIILMMMPIGKKKTEVL
ncbi:MAG: YwaF family protein [Erysipelotrichaceae bacterium]|nr:YwaF family protein [Erysipelotrichaceae bacterium]